MKALRLSSTTFPGRKPPCTPTPHSTDMSFPGGQGGLLPTGTPSTIEPNSWIEALDLATREPRPSTSASVSTIWLIDKQPSPRRGNASDNVESQVTQTTRRTYEKTERECGSTHYVALPHTAFTGVTKLTHTPPTLLACFYFELGWINRIAAGHIRKNTNDQTDSSTLRHHVKP